MPKSELRELIKNHEIEFYEGARKLSATNKKVDADTERTWSEIGASKDDKHIWRFAGHLSQQAEKCVAIKGRSLDEFLMHKENVQLLADFTLWIYIPAGSKVYPVKVWVDADIDKIAQDYTGKREGKLKNGFGVAIIDFSKWAKRMSVFERDWNLALCSAWQGYIGSPGYEWPRTAKEFEVCCAEHAISTVIGTKAQLSRYKILAKKHPNFAGKIYDTLHCFQ